MRYALIDELEYVNGNGLGVSLYTQGCSFQCKGCFNQKAWDFNDGKKWTKKAQEKFLNAIDKPYITRISILGGEPLSSENLYTLISLLCEIKNRFPDKKIWLYTGYTYEEIKTSAYFKGDWNVSGEINDEMARWTCLYLSDVLVDGRYEEDKKDLSLRFRGSTNQRLIDVKATLANNNISLIS